MQYLTYGFHPPLETLDNLTIVEPKTSKNKIIFVLPLFLLDPLVSLAFRKICWPVDGMIHDVHKIRPVQKQDAKPLLQAKDPHDS